MATRGMRILVAVDGSPCSAKAVEQVARRPWPDGSDITVAAVVHTRIPLVPEPTLTGYSLHEYAVDQQREKAEEALRGAEATLAAVPGVTVHRAVLEGDPAKTIVDEAQRTGADLIVVGSHGHGVIKRAVLGSVSQYVAAHAPCSVEIARESHQRAAG